MLITPNDRQSRLRICLFGPYDVRIDGLPLERLHSRKEQWLLALLVLRNGKEIARDWLAGTLWPDSQEEQALAYLRRALYLLKQALGAQAVRIQSPTSRTLRFDLTDAFADVIAFDTALQQGEKASFEQMQAAVKLYRGPLLEGCDEEWAITERHLREQNFQAALETLAAQARDRGDLAGAIQHLTRLIQLNPFHESVYRLLMQTQAESGDFGAMIQAYRNLRLHLRQELNAAPAPETVQLYESLRAAATRTSEERTTEPRTTEPQSPGSSPSSPHSLTRFPRPLTPLIGREREVRYVQHSLQSAPLVTLTGTGGVGKTRIAMQLAQEWNESEVWYVELACLMEPTLLPQVVARTVGIKEVGGTPIEETLVNALASCKALLILDNCEHLLDACAALVHLLLRSCHHLRILTTSRQTLGIPGEVAYPIPPLDIPQLAAPPTSDRIKAGGGLISLLSEYPAVQLFVQRAQNASTSFRITAGNALAIGHICARLDGIPLALEMAAARTNALSPEQISERLSDRFHMLSGGIRSFLPHHQTLRALVDWSYDLLNSKEQQLLHRLSVFAGNWTLEMAEQICAEQHVPRIHPSLFPDEVLDLLTSLVNQSLVQVERGSFGMRYRLLETIREYAAERLPAEGERTTVHRRHCHRYLQLLTTLSNGLDGERSKECVQQFEIEHDNLRAALQWSISAEPSTETAFRFCGLMSSFWIYRGYYSEGQEWCEKALSRSPQTEHTLPIAKMLALNGTLAWLQGNLQRAYLLHRESLEIQRTLGDKRRIAHALDRVGSIAIRMGSHEESRLLLEEAVMMARESGDEKVLTSALVSLGCLADEQGNFINAQDAWEEALTLTRKLGDKRGIAVPLINLGTLAVKRGDYAQARHLYEESLQTCIELGDKGGIAISLFSLGTVAEAEGEFEQAGKLMKKALIDWRDLGSKEFMLMALEGLAYLAVAEAKTLAEVPLTRLRLAARLLSTVEILRERLQCTANAHTRQKHEAQLHFLTATLGEEGKAECWREGSEIALGQAVELALEAL